MKTPRELFKRRRSRTRVALRKTSSGRPRLSVHRSSKHIYAQVINDAEGHTLASASSLDSGVKNAVESTCNNDAAAKVGKLVAERAKAIGVETVVFDRGGYIFHGRVKALADAAREAGLKF